MLEANPKIRARISRRIRHPDVSSRKMRERGKRMTPNPRWMTPSPLRYGCLPGQTFDLPIVFVALSRGFCRGVRREKSDGRRAIPTNDRLTSFPYTSGCLRMSRQASIRRLVSEASMARSLSDSTAHWQEDHRRISDFSAFEYSLAHTFSVPCSSPRRASSSRRISWHRLSSSG